jgi:hypothetical protein
MKDMEEQKCSLIQTLSRHFLETLKKTTKILSQDSQPGGRDSNTDPPKCEPRLLPLLPIQ